MVAARRETFRNSGFSEGERVEVGRDLSPFQRALDQAAGVDRGNTGPNNVQEIESKCGERAGQWVCLGSDQAESPVTTSNFLRSSLTT